MTDDNDLPKLLIDEEPLQVLPSLAIALGLDAAVFLQQLHYWLRKSKHEHDGRVWIYNTFAEWKAQFPFWNLSKMQRIAALLVEKKLIVVRKFGKQNWDRTNWYSIEYENVQKLARAAAPKLLAAKEARDEVARMRHRRFTGELS